MQITYPWDNALTQRHPGHPSQEAHGNRTGAAIFEKHLPAKLSSLRQKDQSNIVKDLTESMNLKELGDLTEKLGQEMEQAKGTKDFQMTWVKHGLATKALNQKIKTSSKELARLKGEQ